MERWTVAARSTADGSGRAREASRMRDAERVGGGGADDAKGGVRRAQRRHRRGSGGGMQMGSTGDWPSGRQM
jgi:hypothetical protein